MFSSISGLCPLDACGTPPLSCDNQKCPQVLPTVSKGTKVPPLENLWVVAMELESEISVFSH